MSAMSNNSGGARELLVVGAFAAIVLLMPFWLPLLGGYQALATKIVIWALFALGFDILLGFTGFLSFGHAAFFGTAAYTTGLMLKHVSADIIPALAVSVSLTLVLAIVLGFLTLRRSGIYFSILTLAFGEMLYAAVLSIFSGITGGDNGLTMSTDPSLLGLPMDGLNVFYVCAALLIGGFALARQIKRSPFGLMLMSIKENPMRLQYTGVNVMAYKMMAFAISGLYTAVAGSMMVVYAPYVATEYMHWTTSGEIVIMSVIGGVNTLLGPMIGAAFMLFFENVVQAFIGEQWKLILGVIFVLVVIFLPGGFIDLARRVRKAMGQMVPPRRDNVPDAPGSMREDRRKGRRADAQQGGR